MDGKPDQEGEECAVEVVADGVVEGLAVGAVPWLLEGIP
jgi:hypothetical protein